MKFQKASQTTQKHINVDNTFVWSMGKLPDTIIVSIVLKNNPCFECCERPLACDPIWFASRPLVHSFNKATYYNCPPKYLANMHICHFAKKIQVYAKPTCPQSQKCMWSLCCDCPFACCPNGWEVCSLPQ